MLFAIALLIVIVFLAFKASPIEKKDHAAIHGAGQIGLLAAVALFGVDYFTSFFYGTGELMSALHPYGLQHYGYIAAGVIAVANIVFGALYMYLARSIQRRRRLLHRLDALSQADPQPDRGGDTDRRLRADHRRLGPLGR